MTPFQERFGRVTVQWMTGLNNVIYRLSEGRVAGNVPSGASICLLITTGRRTGRSRRVPLLFIPDGDKLVVVASRGGMNSHPAWYLNILAEPNVTVQVEARSTPMTARPASELEKQRYWPALAASYEHFDAYQARTDREIPVVVLTPHS